MSAGSKGGGGAAAAAGRYALRRASASAGSHVRGSRGRAGSGGAALGRLAGAAAQPQEGLRGGHIAQPPPPFRREKPNVPAQRSGEPFFQQKRFPGPRISVPGRKHTFLLVVL